MAKQTVFRGTLANDGTGDNLREGARKLNENFDELYTALGDGSTLSSGTFVTTAASQTLTNKSVALGSNTITGTTAQFNTALTDNDFATLAGSETLTNKVINASNNTLSNISTKPLVLTLGLGLFARSIFHSYINQVTILFSMSILPQTSSIQSHF